MYNTISFLSNKQKNKIKPTACTCPLKNLQNVNHYSLEYHDGYNFGKLNCNSVAVDHRWFIGDLKQFLSKHIMITTLSTSAYSIFHVNPKIQIQRTEVRWTCWSVVTSISPKFYQNGCFDVVRLCWDKQVPHAEWTTILFAHWKISANNNIQHSHLSMERCKCC